MATFRIFSLARTLGREAIMAGIRTLVHRRFYARLVDYLYLQSSSYHNTRAVGKGEPCHRLDCKSHASLLGLLSMVFHSGGGQWRVILVSLAIDAASKIDELTTTTTKDAQPSVRTILH